jgi:hypothetical protein
MVHLPGPTAPHEQAWTDQLGTSHPFDLCTKLLPKANLSLRPHEYQPKAFLMRLLFLCLSALLGSATPALAQGQYYPSEVPKGFVILQSTPDYALALASARQAATRLARPLNLHGYRPDKTLGLSASQQECEQSGCRYPCYWPRGQDRAEQSDDISIEYSTSHAGLVKGYYLVVAASGPPNSTTLRQTLARVQRLYPTAYAKTTAVGLGCVQAKR